MTKRVIDNESELSDTFSTESDKSDANTDPWVSDRCKNIVFEVSEITKNNNYFSENSKNNYYKLTFDYEFKEEDKGNSIIFSYSRPYGYTDLLGDLTFAQDVMMKQNKEDIPRLKTFKISNFNENKNINTQVNANNKLRKRLSTYDMKRLQIKQSTIR